MKHIVTFDNGKVGRSRNVEPLRVDLPDDLPLAHQHEDLGTHVRNYVSPLLASRGIDIVVTADRGWVDAGWRQVAAFSIDPPLAVRIGSAA